MKKEISMSDKYIKRSTKMLSIIAAVTKDNAIGKDGKIPWDIPEDLLYFKQLTLNNIVIMGRATYDSIGDVLSNRINIIVTRDRDFKQENAIIAYSPEEAIDIAEQLDANEIFVIGGSSLYDHFINKVDRMYLTYVHLHIPDADRYFPKFDNSQWLSKYSLVRVSENTKTKYQFMTLGRIQYHNKPPALVP